MAPKPPPAPVIRREWTAVPPIQRSIGEHPLTAPSDRFRDDLVTHHDPSVTQGGMGHQVSAEAPPGIVLTVARPAGTRHDGPSMVSRPRVQRRADESVPLSGEWTGDEAAPDGALMEAPSVAPTEAPVMARPAPVSASLQRVATLELPAVAPIQDVPSLTSLPAGAEPTAMASIPVRSPSVQRFDSFISPDAPAAAPEAPPAPRLTLGQARRLGLGAPINKVPARSVQRATPETSDSPPLGPTAEVGKSHEAVVPTISQDSHSGTSVDVPVSTATAEPNRGDLPLAPHMSSGAASQETNSSAEPAGDSQAQQPIEIALQRKADGPAEAPIAAPLAQRAIEGSAVVGSAPGNHSSGSGLEFAASGVDGSSRTRPLRPRLGPAINTQRSIEPNATKASMTDLHSAPLAAAAAPASSVPDVQRSATEIPEAELPVSRTAPSPQPDALTFLSAGPTVPIAGIRTLRPTASVQRAAENGDGSVPAASWQMAPTPLLAASAPEVAPLSTADFAPATAQRLTSAPEVAPLSTADFAPVTAQRLTSAPGSDGVTPSTSRIAIPNFTVQAISELDRAPLLGSLQQVRPATADSAAPAASTRADLPLAPLSIQRAAGESNEPLAPVLDPRSSLFVAQREVMEHVAAEPARSAPVAAGAAAAVASAQPQSEQQIEELAGKLYDRIRSRLRNELLVDRERAGFLTDWR